MDRQEQINEIIDKYKDMTDVKYTVGSSGIHVDFQTSVDGVWQYNFYKFEE